MEGRWMIVTYDGRPVAVEVVTAAATAAVGTGEAGTVPVVPCDDAAIERAARAIAAREGYTNWSDVLDEEDQDFYREAARDAFRAAGETP